MLIAKTILKKEEKNIIKKHGNHAFFIVYINPFCKYLHFNIFLSYFSIFLLINDKKFGIIFLRGENYE